MKHRKQETPPIARHEKCKARIWEIDALRGFLILCVIVAHTLYYSAYVLKLLSLPGIIRFVMQYGGTLFVILSGLSATLGRRSFRRGAMVFAGGMLLTLGSVVAVEQGWMEKSMVIRFGVLHLLGFCMLLYAQLKRLPKRVLLPMALLMIAVGLWLQLKPVIVETRLLFILGLRYQGFQSADYFPILPHLGWFCLGIVLGQTLYPEKKTLLPRVNAANPILRFFCWCGRNSLYIFILHLPLVGGIMMLLF